MLFLLSAAAARAETSSDLARMSLEELSNVEVTSVSKRPERIAEAAASVFVLTNDDIRRSGVQSVAEALRLAPNLGVQRVDALDYGISARGLNGFESANKLLVLIDGRSVYSPFFSGVEWSQLHPDLPDLDRIEVVSGPGGTLWGANAVNGVVNIVTRPADQTQGLAGLAAGGAGYQSYTARYGGRLGADGAFRIYGRAYDRADSIRDGSSAADGWKGGQLGFRTDFDRGPTHLTLQGDAYHDRVPSQIPASPNGKLVGQNLLVRWTQAWSDDADFEVQAYYDRYERIARGILDGVRTYDIQAEQRLTIGQHQLVFGAGHRVWKDRFANFVNGFVLDPPTRRSELSNAFVQDQVALGDVTLTVGVKAEHSTLGGTEWMPNVRLAWRQSPNTLLWGAASSAVRNPSRLDRDLVFPPLLVRSQFEAERLIAYELGYRGRPHPRLSLSATIFYHDYERLRSTEPTPVTILPVRIANGLEGESWGLEIWSDFQATERWRLSAGISGLGKDFRTSDNAVDLSRLAAVGHDPNFQMIARSQHQLSDRLDLDLRVRYVGEVPAELTPGYRKAPAYAEADARLSWRVSDRVELSLAGFNLLDASHPEATEPRRNELRRNYQVAVRYGF
ncbi:MAG: TonB-dependent receptor [Phenylobacterium sp.]|uniref:TonB-dependent receptor plug domain-containing protein n=1 Tax=Phenylobacterium sp. TaxID=1871053 RepID=UPI0027325D7B|nr:TonB-dependent receptor [Phenylobacterium sp.]MDP3175930.1 TonB-dependent receptor [Phenylobacterium sp.]